MRRGDVIRDAAGHDRSELGVRRLSKWLGKGAGETLDCPARLGVASAVAVLLLLLTALGAYGYVGLVGKPSDLDFFIRESFRGDEIDDRNFKYTNEYFLNVFSFRHLTSSDDIWTAHTKGYRLAMGSTTSDEFFLDHEAKVDAELGARTTLHYRFVQAEDYDSRFVRNLVGLSHSFSRVIGAYGYTQLNGFKADIDAGGGLLITTAPVKLNLGFAFPQALLNTKSETGERFERQAFGLGLAATVPVTDRWTVSVRLFENFPLVLERPQEALTFRFRRFVYGLGIEGRLDATSRIRWAVYGENTAKEREFSAPRSGDNTRVSRFALRSSLVYSRAWQGGTLLDAGVLFQRFYEPTRFPLAPGRTVIRERTEAFLFAQLAWHVWKGLFLVPGLFSGPVEAIDRRPNAVAPETGGRSLQAKASVGIAYRFSDQAYLQLQPTFDLDQRRFGGAGPNFVAAF